MPSLVTFLPVVSEKKSFEEIVDDGRTDARTDDDGRRTEDNPNSSPWHFVPGELKTTTSRPTNSFKSGYSKKMLITDMHNYYIKYSRLSLNRTPKILDFFIILLQMTAKYRSTVQQTAPTGAVCSTVDLYLATLCVKSLNITHNFRPV